MAISDTEFDTFTSPDGSIDYSGNEFSFAPKETGVLGLKYNNDAGFFFNANLSYTGNSFSDEQNTKKMDSYTLVNVNGGYQWDDLKFEVYVRNLTDQLYDTTNNVSTADGIQGFRLGPPRETRATVTYQF